jgi:integrase
MPRGRGRTITVRFVDDPTRTAKWGAFWNEYTAGHTGRPKQRSQWFATEAEAETFKRLTLATLESDVPLAPAVVTHWQKDSLAAMAGNHRDRTQLTGWLKEVADRREAATVKNYRDCVTHYLAPAKGHPRHPGLGHLLISEATCHPKVFADYLKGLYDEGVTLSMRRRLKSALSAFCTYAKFAGKLKTNPCFDLGRILRQRDEFDAAAEPHPFSGDEITRIFDQLAAVEDLWARAYYQFLLDVGVRPGEAAALKWTAIDLEAKKARIELAYSEATASADHKSHGDKLPKTHERRTVDLTDAVVKLLLEWHPEQRREAFRRGRPQPVYAFTTRRLGRCRPNGSNLRDIFDRTMTACTITGHTPYDFRDTFATSHLIADWDRKLAWVSRQLGHKTPLTTATFYFGFVDSRRSRGFANEIRQWEQQ